MAINIRRAVSSPMRITLHLSRVRPNTNVIGRSYLKVWKSCSTLRPVRDKS